MNVNDQISTRSTFLPTLGEGSGGKMGRKEGQGGPQNGELAHRKLVPELPEIEHIEGEIVVSRKKRSLINVNQRKVNPKQIRTTIGAQLE